VVCHDCEAVSQCAKACSSSDTCTRRCWPGRSVTLAKPFSCNGGSPTEAGSVTYTCTTWVPVRCPVLVTSTDACGPCTASPLSPNVVYDSPNPNGNNGAVSLAS